ncbi:MAG: ABC transporter substrate-binding protein [Coriobacteriales bacterium]|nr:ABC transporter substrate-binding protein [Coriobacteriales bacterium]
MKASVTRRKFLQVFGASAAGVAAVAATGCSSSTPEPTSGAASSGSGTAAPEAPASIPAVVGYWGGTCEAPIYVAFENGYFEECGVAAEPLLITAGSAEPLANGELDFFQATPNFFPLIKNGTAIKLIDNVHTGCIQGVAGPGKGITSVKDLEGKTVGTFAAQDMGQIFLSSAMKNAGADHTKVNWVVYGGGPATLAALFSGEIDAFAHFDPYPEVATLLGATKIFNNATDTPFSGYTCCFLAMNELTLDKEDGPELARRVAKAFQMADEFIMENPGEAAKIIQDGGYVASSAAMLENFGYTAPSEAETIDIHERLLSSYYFGGGDKAIYEKSLRANWDICNDAGALDDAPTNQAEYDSYVENLVALAGTWYGSDS